VHQETLAGEPPDSSRQQLLDFEQVAAGGWRGGLALQRRSTAIDRVTEAAQNPIATADAGWEEIGNMA